MTRFLYKYPCRAALIALVLLYTLALCPGVQAYADIPEEIKDGIEDTIGGLDIYGLEQIYSTLPEDVRSLWGEGSLSSLISDFALGQGSIDDDNLLSGLVSMLKGSLPAMLPMLVGLSCIAILSGFLRAMSDSGMSGLSDITGFICRCFAIAVALSSFLSLAVIAREAIAKTASFIEIAFPVLMTLLSASGGITSSAIIEPAMVMLSSSMAMALENVVIPIILAGGALGVVNSITGRVQLSQLFKLSKTLAKWIIGLLFTIYFGVTSIQGLTAASFDGLSIRTAKFAVDKMIPIVGGMVSGTVDTVLGCSMLVKNAVGVSAIILAFSIVASPLIKLAAGMFMFRVAAAITEPIGDEKMPKMLEMLAEVLTYLFAAALSLSVMFIITVGLIIGVGNAALLG